MPAGIPTEWQAINASEKHLTAAHKLQSLAMQFGRSGALRVGSKREPAETDAAIESCKSNRVRRDDSLSQYSLWLRDSR